MTQVHTAVVLQGTLQALHKPSQPTDELPIFALWSSALKSHTAYYLRPQLPYRPLLIHCCQKNQWKHMCRTPAGPLKRCFKRTNLCYLNPLEVTQLWTSPAAPASFPAEEHVTHTSSPHLARLALPSDETTNCPSQHGKEISDPMLNHWHFCRARKPSSTAFWVTPWFNGPFCTISLY